MKLRQKDAKKQKRCLRKRGNWENMLCSLKPHPGSADQHLLKQTRCLHLIALAGLFFKVSLFELL